MPEPIHRCHAIECDTPVPPRLLMCARHWRMVPRKLQRRVWATYRPGQEIDKQPSAEYLEAQQAAVAAVRQRELEQRPGWAKSMRELAPGLYTDGAELHIDASACLAHYGHPPTQANVAMLIVAARENLPEIPVSVVEEGHHG